MQQSLSIKIPIGEATLEGDLKIPHGVQGAVLFAHGSGSSRHSPRNQFVAQALQEAGFATLLFDLLTEQEEQFDRITAQLRFDIEFLANRLIRATAWLAEQEGFGGTKFGYFGASTGAAAALVAAAKTRRIAAVVSRGGRPDLAGNALPQVQAPVLLIVGTRDSEVLDLNRSALSRIICEKKLETIPGATHLFEEPGALEQVARIARDWFERFLGQVHGSPQVQ